MGSRSTRHIVVVMGTRPEALKLAPVIRELRRHRTEFHVTVLCTGQHREMLAQALSSLGIAADRDLAVMQPDQTLGSLTASLLIACQREIEVLNPDLVIVQGDTASAFVAALAAFYNKVPVAHVEAGLRTRERYNPFPEEINRRLVADLASLHFAPTLRAAAALRKEGISSEAIHVTGNTIVDALLWLRKHPAPISHGTQDAISRSHGRLVLITCHRRESLGADLDAIVAALGELAARFPDHLFFFPVHLNPRVRQQVVPRLNGIANILLSDPVPYEDLLELLKTATLVITDSGGIQEEAPSFGVPVIVLRRTTERPEGVRAGFARLVPPDSGRIVSIASRWMIQDRRTLLHGRPNPYGDGDASKRIVQILRTTRF